MAKAHFNCHDCGDTVAVFGSNRAAADRLAAYREQQEALCHDCWQKARAKQREEEAQQAAEQAAQTGLPVLQGTEKQVAWAETIRAAVTQNLAVMLAKVRGLAADGLDEHGVLLIMEEAVGLIQGQDSAHWWIEHRDGGQWVYAQDLLRWLAGPGLRPGLRRSTTELVEAARARLGGLRPTVETAPPAIVADAKAEATVRPPEPVTETVAELLIAGQALHVTFPEKRDDFRELVKTQLGLTWGEGYWQRQIGCLAGDIDDRLVEAGHRLLAAGFPVRIYDPALRARAVAGEFAAEHTRWVTRRTQGAKAGWFCLVWGRDEDYYAPARKLPGSRYDKPYVVAPPEQVEEVLDFAERYDFRLSRSGLELADQARANREAALVAKVAAKPKAKGQRITQANKPEAMPAPEVEEVDDELRD